MKALYFEQEGQKKIELEDGTVFEAQAKESKAAFLKRIAGVVDESYMESMEVTEKKAAKGKTTSKAKTETAVEPKPYIAPEVDGNNNETEEPEAAKAKKEPKTKKEPKAKKEPKPKPEPKEKAPKPTLNDALEAKKNAEQYVGKVVDFVPFRAAYTVTGEVRQVVIDNRVNRAYFRIYDEDGKLYHTDTSNANTAKFKVNEKATAELIEKKEKQVEERLALLQQKEQEKMQAAADRIAKRKAERAEARAQRKAEREALSQEQAALRDAKKAISTAQTAIKRKIAEKVKLEAKMQALQEKLNEVNAAIEKGEAAKAQAETRYAEEEAALKEQQATTATDEAAGKK